MLQFKSLILHNFGSYNHAEIDLQNKGFCLVTGENHCIKDNALSNGSGKSMLWSGICFAITGETIQGLKSNLKNVYTEEADAYVTLDFFVSKDHFVITRIIAPKSDLKIYKNDIDVSGKGIRESETKLAELIPGLDRTLLASSIILGQGLPSKFSSFKPVGRKELLEQLTKSDFMINDIKERIANRLNTLSTQLRGLEDRLLITRTNLSSNQQTYTNYQQQIDTWVQPNYEVELAKLNTELIKLENSINLQNTKIKSLEEIYENSNNKLLARTAEKTSLSTRLLEDFTNAIKPIQTKKVELETQLRLLQTKLNAFKQNPDVCPTCGQKLPNAEHIKKERADTEAQIQVLTESLATLTQELASKNQTNLEHKTKINNEFDESINQLRNEALTNKNLLNNAKQELININSKYLLVKNQITTLTLQRDTATQRFNELKNNVAKTLQTITSLETSIKELETSKIETEEHQQRVKWLDTLTKRDFRGYILSDIIKYLDTKAKMYAATVFGHKDLNIYLDGNDLDISYCGKMFDNLSGGEKTRVDLIIQFSIRDLLATYMGIESNILVLDEVTDFLDAQSCDAVMQMIEKDLKAVESVFIISHHSDELGLPIDSELHVTKNASGISTVTQC